MLWRVFAALPLLAFASLEGDADTTTEVFKVNDDVLYLSAVEVDQPDDPSGGMGAEGNSIFTTNGYLQACLSTEECPDYHVCINKGCQREVDNT